MSSQKEQRNQSVDLTARQLKFDGLNKVHFWAYGTGHFLNDLTAACWFNYLLFFLKTVVKTSAAPIALLSGQVCDGLVTPIVGYLSDKSETRLGKRTPWYVFGLITILICFRPIFSPFRSDNSAYQYLYYSFFPAMFNVGWACLQISHMSLVPSLTCSRKRRDRLNNLRNSFTFVANLMVLSVGLIVFYLMNDKQLEYQLISDIVIGVGLASSVFFLYFVRQKELVAICQQKKIIFKERITKKTTQDRIKDSIQPQESIQSDRHMAKNATESTVDDKCEVEDVPILQEAKKDINITHWLKKPKFYLFGICYMCVRLNSNIFGTFVPFYLIYVLNLSNSTKSQNTIPFSVALVPLIIYFSSSLVSAKIASLYCKIGRRKTLLIGTVLSVFSLGAMFFLHQNNSSLVYCLAIFIGVSQSMILATGINLISDVVGSKSQSGAIVFGIYSFLDKISAGIIIYFIAKLECFSQETLDLPQEQKDTIKETVIFIPIASALLAAFMVLFGSVSEYMHRQEAAFSESKLQDKQFVHSVTLH